MTAAITTRLVDTVTTPMLLKLVQSGKVKPSQLITHRKPNPLIPLLLRTLSN